MVFILSLVSIKLWVLVMWVMHNFNNIMVAFMEFIMVVVSILHDSTFNCM